jgi:CheY-like chemotaxis protein
VRHQDGVNLQTEETKPRILIVDDEASIRAALERWFTLRGFEVHQAADGQEAVAICGKSSFDVITMDLEMPNMGGIEATVEIKKLLPEVPIIVLTGYSKNADIAVQNGAAKVLSKPLRLKELETEVRNIIAQH